MTNSSNEIKVRTALLEILCYLIYEVEVLHLRLWTGFIISGIENKIFLLPMWINQGSIPSNIPELWRRTSPALGTNTSTWDSMQLDLCWRTLTIFLDVQTLFDPCLILLEKLVGSGILYNSQLNAGWWPLGKFFLKGRRRKNNNQPNPGWWRLPKGRF